LPPDGAFAVLVEPPVAPLPIVMVYVPVGNGDVMVTFCDKNANVEENPLVSFVCNPPAPPPAPISKEPPPPPPTATYNIEYAVVTLITELLVNL
jgi:hypothetical protein